MEADERLESAPVKQKKKKRGEQLLISQYVGRMAVLLGSRCGWYQAHCIADHNPACGSGLESKPRIVLLQNRQTRTYMRFQIPDLAGPVGGRRTEPAYSFITALSLLNRSLESHQLDHLILGFLWSEGRLIG